jgi:hypothetical protein
MKYDRTVIAYHGCDADIADRLIAGEPFRRSRNDYDWLGEGIYFWEFGQHRALQFALEQKARGKLQRPAVVGALIQLGRCFDLMDTRFTGELEKAFLRFRRVHERLGVPMPRNAGATPDQLLRRRDCAVINHHLAGLAAAHEEFDTIRCGFTEDAPAYEGSGIFLKSHIQIAVRNPPCIVGVFRPSVNHEQ